MIQCHKIEANAINCSYVSVKIVDYTEQRRKEYLLEFLNLERFGSKQ